VQFEGTHGAIWFSGWNQPMSRAARAVASPHVVSIGDFRPLARLRLPRPVFDYLDGGADGEVTLRENCRVFDDVTFRPRYAVPVSDCDLRTRVLGFDISFPALLAPVGYSRLMHPDGEAGAARAAGAAGTAYILSTISGHRVEDVKAASTGPVCFQLYLMGGREASEAVIERARVAGCAALVVTVDTPVAGLRERDFRNGMKELMGGSFVSQLPFLPQMLARPGWIVSYLLDGGLSKLPNVVIPGKGPMELVDVGAALARSAVTWEDLGWMRKHWPGPIVIKGLLTGDDARRAVDAGAAAVVVSNHGGRQLDGSRSTFDQLAEIVDAVGDKIDVLFDGGVQRGTHVLKALSLGAKAVGVGRLYLFPLAAAGQPGVERALGLMRAELERDMKLMGCTSIKQLSRSNLRFRG
jgi:isopentenyl diphosphate isomerase/L-lactate dehydrogenase-like FMN-dependent dehydrogenase